MNQKTAKKLHHLCVITSTDQKSGEERYQTLKKNWNKTPAPSRHALFKQLEKAAELMIESRARIEQKLDDMKNSA